ncbi:MAG: hypothetical protein GF329_19640 [Candidatus Lokiarchaeota archaeon]|nr:hypothetical protein [Candidatus Lokiarchaeota archaeon]
MERQGIQIFDQIRARLKKKGKDDAAKNVKKPVIYLIGLALNQTPALWAMLSNMFSGGNSTYYTSMYGVGLVVLMIYSALVLKENISKMEYIGASILCIGTIILGLELIFRPSMSSYDMNYQVFIIFLIVYSIISGILITFAYKNKSSLLIGIVFGVVSGSLGCLDPLFKGLGQSFGVEITGFLPDLTNPIAVTIFILSFVFGFGAFLVTQWGFAKKSEASVLVPSYNAAYLTLPVLVYFISYFPYYLIYSTTILGMLLTIVGILIMHIYNEKQRENKDEKRVEKG